MVLLVFSTPMIALAQQNLGLAEAIIAAEQDAKPMSIKRREVLLGFYVFGPRLLWLLPCNHLHLRHDSLVNRQNISVFIHKLTKQRYGTTKQVLLFWAVWLDRLLYP